MKILGEGGFCTIYEDTCMGTPCAIKRSKPKKILKEVKILEKLAGCKHVVKMLDYNIEQGYIKYELLYTTLKNKIYNEDMTNEEIKKIADQLLIGIQEIHDAGILHCDIKPENIMFNDMGDLKIIDFCDSVLIKDLERKTHIVHTPGYTSPEYIIGAPLTTNVDYWMYGCILIEMIIRDRLFDPYKDNNMSYKAMYIGMVLRMVKFSDDFLNSGKRTSKYFIKHNEEWIYKFNYLKGCKISLYKLLKNNGCQDARYWEKRIMPYIIR